MVGDNDAGGVATYAQAGQNYGYTLLWVLLLLVPVLIVNQEMVVRLGAVTGAGHARLINERFGRFWGWFSVGDLFLLNFLTITTEFIGVSLALAYFGVSKYIAVPVAAVLLVAITAGGSFRRWERVMLAFVAASLVLVPLAFLSHPAYGASAYHLVVPGIQGGISSDAILLIISPTRSASRTRSAARTASSARCSRSCCLTPASSALRGRPGHQLRLR
jgi:Mn2+/Fe2+ NRAMP family transporter